MPQVVLTQGDACHLPLRDQSLHCCVVSPPYYGLRAYQGVEPSCWPGGQYSPVPGAPPVVVPDWQGTLGNEPTPSLYVWHTLLWLREVRRVLREDGVAWVIIGDSFATNPGNGRGGETVEGGTPHRSSSDKTGVGYPQGCLLGIPAQVQLAAAADGWIVREDAIWAKVSPMPESVRGWFFTQARCRCVFHQRSQEAWRNGSTPQRSQSDHDPANMKAFAPAQPDPACPTCGGTGRLERVVLRKGSWRHTRAHETILMLTKGMGYFSNSEAVREEATMTPQRRSHGHSLCTYDPPGRQAPSRGDRGVKDLPGVDGPGGRNPRSVVTPAPSALGLEHYASFPPSLIEGLIKATCPERCCPQCGQGWAVSITSEGGTWPQRPSAGAPMRYGFSQAAHTGVGSSITTVHALLPTCPHYCTCATSAPCTCGKLPLTASTPGWVLDCFSGAGTTALVARALGRHSLGLDASRTYVRLARERLGLTDLARWEGQTTPVVDTYTDLPLFGVRES